MREAQFLTKFREELSPAARWTSALAVSDAIAILAAGAVAKIIFVDFTLGLDRPIPEFVPSMLLLCVGLYLFMKQMDLYEIETLLKPTISVGKLIGALGLSFLVLVGGIYLLEAGELLPRVWILGWFLLGIPALVLVRWAVMKRVGRLVADGRLSQRVALFGTREFVDGFAEQAERAGRFMRVTGRYYASASEAAGEPVGGGLGDLRDALSRGSYDRVVVAMPAAEKAGIRAAVKALGAFSTELLLCTDLEPAPVSVAGGWTIGKIKADVVNTVPPSERYGLVKQVLDWAIAGVGLLMLAPILVLIAVAIKLDSSGPVFFRQRRYGQNNRIFRIFKFRTMHVAEDGAVVKQAERGDPRVTRVGRFLRSTSLDEVPQLFNVLAGDMSIVGPRPHALAHDNDFEERLDTFARRRRVRPGLTGWAQVHGFRGETRTTEDVRLRLEHDLYYIDNWSIWLDIEIILRTLLVVARGAY